MHIKLAEFWVSHGDYLLVTVMAIAGLALLSSLLPRYTSGARISSVIWVVFLAVLAGGWKATQISGQRAREESMAQVSALAPTYAYELESMGHYLLPSDASPEDPIYQSIIEAQIEWQKLNPAAHDIYTMRKRSDGTNILIADSETDYDGNGRFDGDMEARTPIGTVYENADDGLELAFQGEANFEPDIITDEWGSWVSAFVPMRDPKGNVEAVVGVDFDAASWLAAISKARGESIAVVILLLVIVAGSGTAIGLLRADVIKRTHAEQRTRQSEQRLRLTIGQMPLGFIEWDVEARIIAWNPSAERIFGYNECEVIGKSVFPLIVAPSARPHVDNIWAELLCNGGGSHSINENLTKHGKVITCEWFNTPLVDAQGHVVGVISLLQDITERIKLEKHVQQSDRLSAVGQLAAGVAHDFNNILTVITGHTGLLLAQDTLPEDTCKDIRRIESAAMRAATLTRQLLAFSRKQAMFPRPMRLTTAIDSATSMLSRLLLPDLRIEVRIAPNVPPVEADAAMIEQIITNLVLNARDAIAGPGCITISLDSAVISQEITYRNLDARPGVAVCLSVSDTGSGVEPGIIGRIFEPFFTTKPKGRGTGLGLCVVHGIVQQHRGWITVESTPGKGSTFRVFLPPTTREVPGENSESDYPYTTQTSSSASTKTILLAEDERMVRDLARNILEDAGYRVIESADGHEALKLWNANRDKIDLLFTDMVMPNGMTGRDLSNHILKDRPDLPVIYASGYSIELTAPDFKETSRRLFIPKPYLTNQLLSTIDRCLSN